MPKYIDIHSHVNFKTFDVDRDEVIRRALDNDTWVINIGTQFDTSKYAVQMTSDYKEGVYATVGLHPIHTGASFHDVDELGAEGAEFTSRGEIFDKEKYRELARNKKVVAIGECGLDYYRTEPESIEKQKAAFISQIELANDLDLPLMVHVRNNYDGGVLNPYDDAIDILRKYSRTKGDIHFFEGSLQNAKDFISLGFMISFTGAITYPPRKNGKGCNYEEIIKNIPLESIMADTDSPYVAPIPYRGERNEPVYVEVIVNKIAEIKGLSVEETAQAIFANAQRLFKI